MGQTPREIVDFLSDRISQYRDEDGLVGAQAGVYGGNGLLYLSEYVVILQRLRILNDSDRAEYRRAVKTCEVATGCYQRSRSRMNADNEGPDDYVGLGAGAAACDPSIAQEILAYGRKYRVDLFYIVLSMGWVRLALWANRWNLSLPYNYNNLEPCRPTGNRESWLGRQPQLIAHLQFAAGEKPPLWRKLVWCIAVMTAFLAPADDMDARILSYLLVVTAEGKSWLCSLAARFWWRQLRRQYPAGMKEVFSRYFGMDHPITVLCQD